MDRKHVVVIVLSFLAFLLALVATFTPGWTAGNGFYFGFFQICHRGVCTGSTRLLEANTATKASAAFMVIGTFVLLVGFVCVVMGAKNSENCKLRVGGIITCIGGIAVLIGVAVFAGKYSGDPFSFSFGFAWVAAFFGMAAGGLAFKIGSD